jgi:predicted membrane protein
MVAEMVTMLLFEITQFRLNNRPMSEKDQVSVFGRKFEKLGQDRRVKILAAYVVIDKNLECAFERIRTSRNRYLHLWSQDHEQLPLDTIKSFEAAVVLVVSAIGQNIKDGKIVMNPTLVIYLKQKGTYRGEEDA